MAILITVLMPGLVKAATQIGTGTVHFDGSSTYNFCLNGDCTHLVDKCTVTDAVGTTISYCADPTVEHSQYYSGVTKNMYNLTDYYSQDKITHMALVQKYINDNYSGRTAYLASQVYIWNQLGFTTAPTEISNYSSIISAAESYYQANKDNYEGYGYFFVYGASQNNMSLRVKAAPKGRIRVFKIKQ